MSSALVLSADPPQAHHHPSGTGVGPILSRSLFQDSRSWPGVLAMCIVSSGVGYILVSSTAWGHAVGLLVFLAHMAGGSQWVLSTVLLQERTEDRYRGRVFATEWLLLTLADSLSIVAASLLLETGLLELRGAIRVFRLVLIVGGVLWGILVIPREKRLALPDPPRSPRAEVEPPFFTSLSFGIAA